MTTDASREPSLRHDPPEVPGYRLEAREAIPLQRVGVAGLLSWPFWIALFLGTGFAIHGWGLPGISLASLLLHIPGTVFALVLVFILHELTHGLMARSMGARPFYGFSPGTIDAFFYTSFHDPVTRNQYLAIAVAPLIVLTALSIIALATFWTLVIPIVAFASYNAAGAVGDLWILLRVRRLPRDAIIFDLADGYAAFVPD